MGVLMSEQDMELIELTADFALEFRRLASEYQSQGDERYAAGIEDFSGYLGRLKESSLGINVPPHRVPATTFWLANGKRLIGRSSLRHWLTTELAHEGGHIGYDIRPSERRKGYGTLILELTLVKARALGLSQTLLTCDADNVASARIIEKNGGELQRQTISQRTGKIISQYWIKL